MIRSPLTIYNIYDVNRVLFRHIICEFAREANGLDTWHGIDTRDEIDKLWQTWTQLKTLSETTREQLRVVGKFLYNVKEEEVELKQTPAHKLSIYRGVDDARATPSHVANRFLVVEPWSLNETDYPSYDEIKQYVEKARLGATMLTESEARTNRYVNSMMPIFTFSNPFLV